MLAASPWKLHTDLVANDECKLRFGVPASNLLEVCDIGTLSTNALKRAVSLVEESLQSRMNVGLMEL